MPRSRRTKRLARAMAAVLGVVGTLSVAPLGAGATSTELWTPSDAPLPAQLPDGNPPDNMDLQATSCVDASFCVSVGATGDSDNGYPLAEVLANGVWTPQVLPLPANASGTAGTGGWLDSVSCPTDGTCVAAGKYDTSDPAIDSGGQNGLLETLSDGVWTPFELLLPGGPDSGLVQSASVACPGPTSCYAAFSEADDQNSYVGVLSTWNGEAWSAPTILPAPADYATNYNINSISCADAADCVASGFYTSQDHTDGALLVTLASGVWTAAEAPLPDNAATTWVSTPQATLNGVSCPQVGSCVAAGSYDDSSGHEQPLIVQQEAGIWAPIEGQGPPNSNTGPHPATILQAVSCDDPGDCVATGEFTNNAAAGWLGGMIATSSNGVWGAATVAPLPPSNRPETRAVTPSVAHRPPQGPLTGTGLDPAPSPGVARGPRVAPAFPPAGSGSTLGLDGLSCASDGFCAAVGDNGNSGLIETNETLDGSPPPLTLASVLPAAGPAGGGTVVTIIGAGFGPDAVVHFGALTVPTTYVDATQLTAVVPPDDGLAVVEVQVEDDGELYGGLAFTYTDPLASLNLSPSAGLTGNEPIAVSGSTGARAKVLVTLEECSSPLYSSATCDTANSVTTNSKVTGSFGPVAFHLAVGPIDADADTCGLSTSSPCNLVLVEGTDTLQSSTISFQVPTATISARSGVVARQHETVVAENFPLKNTVEALECTSGVTSPAQTDNCDSATAVTGPVRTGVTTLTLTVRVGTKFVDPSGGTCDPGASCAVLVFDRTDPAVSVTVPFTLAP